MVDQLWCWVLDDTTVVSCFPSHSCCNSHYGKFCELFNTIRPSVDECNSVWDMYSLLVKGAINHLFSQKNREFADLIEIYRWVVGKKAASQMTHFQQLNRNSHRSLGNLSDEERRSVLLGDFLERDLLFEVADIIDELKMIRHIFSTQHAVLKSLRFALRNLDNSREEINNPDDCITVDGDTVSGVAGCHVNSANDMLNTLLAGIGVVEDDAKHTQEMLLNLLDLRQKTASLAEARSTTQQGRAVMLFTIVTIVFLPLSFFSSYFGQNVSEITGDDKNPSTWDMWKIATPISVIVIVLALIISYFITRSQIEMLRWKGIPFNLRWYMKYHFSDMIHHSFARIRYFVIKILGFTSLIVKCPFIIVFHVVKEKSLRPVKKVPQGLFREAFGQPSAKTRDSMV